MNKQIKCFEQECLNKNVFQIDQMRINELKIHCRNYRHQCELNPFLQKVVGAEFSAKTSDKVIIFAKYFIRKLLHKVPRPGKSKTRSGFFPGREKTWFQEGLLDR